MIETTLVRQKTINAVDNHEKAKEFSSYIDLWSAVLERAVLDLNFWRKIPAKDSRVIYDSAVHWWVSDNDGFGSFNWICSILNYDPEAVRANCYDVHKEKILHGINI